MAATEGKQSHKICDNSVTTFSSGSKHWYYYCFNMLHYILFFQEGEDTLKSWQNNIT